MLVATIVSSLAFTQRRGMMQVFPESLQNFWDNWELRIMVVSSLSIQIILLLLGNKRKLHTNISLRITLWSAYLFSDILATTSLGVLSSKEGENKGDYVEPKYVIVGLWAPLLLIHLGGQDTISAYSMEDNALWNRRLVTYIGQVVAAFFIVLRSWTNADLNILAIPMFIGGCIKIGERIWVLWSASSQQFKESLFPDPDPGPNYARYMEAYNSASYEGFKVDVECLHESPSTAAAGVDHTTHAVSQGNIINMVPLTLIDHPIYATIRTAHKFLKISKILFADLILSFEDVSESRTSLMSGKGKEGFDLMEIELGFMYDVFYTKAPVLYSFRGYFLRFVTLFCSIGVLCAFLTMDKNQYPRVDVFITSVLLIGAIILEIFSVILMLFSDWTVLLLSKHKNEVTSMLISFIQYVKGKKRWSCKIGQFNFINFCLLRARKERHSNLGKFLRLKCGFNCGRTLKKQVKKCGLTRMIIGAWQSYQKYNHTDTNTIISGDMKEIIFEHFTNKIEEARNMGVDEFEKNVTRCCNHRGNKVLEILESELKQHIKDKEEVEEKIKKIRWSVEVDFDESIILWHIVTNICYNSVMDEEILENGRSYREASKCLSEYMLYLLIMRPSMLPNGIGEIRFQDTFAEATAYVKDRHSIQNEKQVCNMIQSLSQNIDKVSPSKVKGDRSKSVLFDALRLAENVKEIRNDFVEWERKKMWKFMTHVWIEMLGYAACHCQVVHHAQQLRHGGELITHVWLLMAHLGITDRLQISKGFGRTKLIRI